MRRRLALLVVLGLMPALACTDGEESAEELCELLGAPPPGDQWAEADAIVFIDPDADDRQIEEIRSTIDDHPEVEETEWVDQEAAYEAFLEQFSDRPDMIETLDADSLPPSVRVRFTDDGRSHGADLRARFENQAGVYRVVNRMPGMPFSLVDRLVRPITQGAVAANMTAGMSSGSADLGLGDVAPDDMRDYAETLDAFWAAPMTFEDRDAATDAARQVAAYYDTKCG